MSVARLATSFPVDDRPLPPRSSVTASSATTPSPPTPSSSPSARSASPHPRVDEHYSRDRKLGLPRFGGQLRVVDCPG